MKALLYRLSYIAIAPTAGLEPASRPGRSRMPFRSASWAMNCWSDRRDSNSHSLSGLIAFKARASSDCATIRSWCEAPDSNRKAPRFELGRYANSLQLRVVWCLPRDSNSEHLHSECSASTNCARKANHVVPSAGLEPAAIRPSSVCVCQFRQLGMASSAALEAATSRLGFGRSSN